MVRKVKIIYADPPWQYKDKARAGERGAEFKYDVMSMNELLDMSSKVKKISGDDCVLFLWSTYPMLPNAITLMNEWGFTYKTVAFTWVKKTKKGKDHYGMGHWTRANPEICLLGIKGKPKPESHGVRNLVYSQIREHSQKPDEIRDMIVELCGDVPRIELFSRKKLKGWKYHGNEILNKN